MVRLETPSADVHPYGKYLTPEDPIRQVRVNAFLILTYSKTREMRHPPMLVRRWLEARIWPDGLPVGSATE